VIAAASEDYTVLVSYYHKCQEINNAVGDAINLSFKICGGIGMRGRGKKEEES